MKKVNFQSQEFEFNQWEAAFACYFKMVEQFGAENVQFVMSSHPYTSGYWVEQAGCKVSLDDTVFPHDKVAFLRDHVQQEISTAAVTGHHPKFINQVA